MNSDTRATLPRERNFRKALLNELLYADPLARTSVYFFMVFSLLFLTAAALLDYSKVRELRVASWVVSGAYLLYVVGWLTTVITTVKGARRGVEWLLLADRGKLETLFNKNRRGLKPVERRFALVAYDNRIERFDIDNGRLSTQGKVEIDVEWRCSDDREATLYLYSDTGDMQDDVRALRTRSSARCLEVKRGGQPIRYVHTNVRIDDNYNYYAWIEVDFYGRLILSVENSGHWTRRIETPTEYATRTEEWDRAKKRVQAVRQPPPPPEKKPTSVERALAAVERFAAEAKTAQEEEEAIKKAFDIYGLDRYDREEFMERYRHDRDKQGSS